MQKFGACMADLMPIMQAEMMKAQAKLNQSPLGSTNQGRALRSRRSLEVSLLTNPGGLYFVSSS